MVTWSEKYDLSVHGRVHDFAMQSSETRVSPWVIYFADILIIS